MSGPHPSIRIIAIEGPIGVGKTTLAHRLASTYATDLMLEEADENPFLPKFYRDPARYALPTQLYFLFQRVEQLEHYHQSDLFTPVNICDYMLEKDRLFAELTLNADDYEMYCTVYEKVVETLPTPDVVLYLHAKVATLCDRIEHRGLPYEQQIESEYLDRLSSAYAKFFSEYRAAPLLIVDTDVVNFVDGDVHYEQLLAHLAAGVTGVEVLDLGSMW